jgi:ketopantoate reductase
MEKKKMAVIGVGGRTGTMFAFELKNSADILGVAKEKEANLIKEKHFYIKRENGFSELFDLKVIKDTDFHQEPEPDIIFLATKNPVSAPIRYYLKELKKKPILLISQNGISAIFDAKKTLKEIFGNEAEKIRLVRIVLFNPIDKEKEENKIYIKYSLPIKAAFSEVSGQVLRSDSGQVEIEDIVKIFKEAGFEIKEFPQKDSKNLEFSKLFLNLIGMASASRGLSVKEGFSDKETFDEEIKVIKEYIRTVKSTGGNFLNFPNYPVKLLANLFVFLPFFILLPFRNILADIISKGRGGKPKDLDEIDYYNGAVVELGKKTGVKTPVNEKVYKRVLEKIR